MRLLAKYLRAIPTDVRAYFRPFLYGLFGGLAAVGFQAGIKVLEWVLWTQLSHIATGYFVLASLVTILVTVDQVFAGSIDSVQIEKLCAEYPYGQFPLVIDGRLVGMLDRKSLLDDHAPEQAVKQAETVYASATIREAVAKMVDKSASLLVVLSTDETPIGIVALHDVVRLHSQVADAM